VKENLKECFSAALYTCYDSIRPDVVLEYAWRFKMIDMAFPYLIQVMREYTTKVDGLIKETEKKKQAEEKKSENSAFSGPIVEDTMYMNQLPQLTYYPTDPSAMGMGMGMGVGVVPGMPYPGVMPGMGGYPDNNSYSGFH